MPDYPETRDITIPVNLFSSASLQKAVDDAMDKLGPGTNGGILVHADLKGAAIVATKAGEHWSVSVAAGLAYGGQFEGEISIIARF